MNDEWGDAMKRAFVTQEDCTCQSMGGHYGPHDDDCPTALLRERLTHWEYRPGRVEKVVMAIGTAMTAPTLPVAMWLLLHLGHRVAVALWAAVLGAWLTVCFTVDFPGWWSLATIPLGMWLGGVAGSMVLPAMKLSIARQQLKDL